MDELASILELVSTPWHLADGGAWSDTAILTPEQMKWARLTPLPLVNDSRVILAGDCDLEWFRLLAPWHIDERGIYRVSAVGRVNLKELYTSRMEQGIYRAMYG